MWNFDQPGFRRREVQTEPLVAHFLSGVVWAEHGAIAPFESVFSRYRMHGLPLLEWSMSDLALPLFETLRLAGASKGFFFEISEGKPPPHLFWECNLTADLAQIVKNEELLEPSIIFLDDAGVSIIASWYTDFALWFMEPSVFERHLANHPLDLDLRADANPCLINRFEDALKASFRRLADWDDDMDRHSSTIIADYDWQLASNQPNS